MGTNTNYSTSSKDKDILSGRQAFLPESEPRYPSLDEINLTLPEAARYCRMAIPTFRLYLKRREVAGSKLGKAWLFTKPDLDAFLARYRVKTSAELEAMSNQMLRRTRR